MATQRKAPDDLPLPDADRLQRAATAAIERVRERRGLYTWLAIAALAVVVVVLVLLNTQRSKKTSAFTPLWRRSEAVRSKLAINLSAADELNDLEGYLEKIRGSKEEGMALWLLAAWRYREASTPDKLTFDDREPHLRKALAYLQELQEERFDGMLLAKARWYTSSSLTPIDRLTTQVEEDLEYERANAYEEPAPDDAVVAVLRTSAGDVYLQFFSKLAPLHTKNFLKLATMGVYNGTVFHFVGGGPESPRSLMGGDPYSFFYNDPLKKDHILRWGNGTVGYDLPPEEARFRIIHRPRIVTSQRRERADWDNGVQFQIMIAPDPQLDRQHTPFAKVTDGMDIVEKAAKEAKTVAEHSRYKDDFAFGSLATRHLIVEPVVIHKVVVFESGKAREHSFLLTDDEQGLATIKNTEVAPLPEDAIHAGRVLRPIDAEGEVVAGLHVPFPEDMDPDKADVKGERKAGPQPGPESSRRAVWPANPKPRSVARSNSSSRSNSAGEK